VWRRCNKCRLDLRSMPYTHRNSHSPARCDPNPNITPSRYYCFCRSGPFRCVYGSDLNSRIFRNSLPNETHSTHQPTHNPLTISTLTEHRNRNGWSAIRRQVVSSKLLPPFSMTYSTPTNEHVAGTWSRRTTSTPTSSKSGSDS